MKLLDVNRNTTEFIAKVKDNYFFGKAMEKFIAVGYIDIYYIYIYIYII